LVDLLRSLLVDTQISLEFNLAWQKIKVKVYYYAIGKADIYFLDAPEIFDELYPDNLEARAKQMLVLRKASLGLLKVLKEKQLIKQEIVLLTNEIYTGLVHPEAIKDEYSKEFQNILVLQINHTVIPAGMPDFPSHLFDLLGLNLSLRPYILNKERLSIADLIFILSEIILGVSQEHTDRLKNEVIPQFMHKIIFDNNTNCVHPLHWMAKGFIDLLLNYAEFLGSLSLEELFSSIEKDSFIKEQFIKDLNEVKQRCVLSLNKKGLQDLDLNLPVIPLLRRIVPYKSIDTFIIKILENQQYRQRFMKAQVVVLLGGRIFDRPDGYGASHLERIKELLKEYPELKTRVGIIYDYNIAEAPIIWQGCFASIMISCRGKEASATSMMKAIINAGFMIATFDGAIPELLLDYNENPSTGNGFLVSYSYRDPDGEVRPNAESLLKALEDAGSLFKENNFGQILYNAFKTGLLKCNVITGQAPSIISIINQEREKRLREEEKRKQIITDFWQKNSNLVKEILKEGRNGIQPFGFHVEGYRKVLAESCAIEGFRNTLSKIIDEGNTLHDNFNDYLTYFDYLLKDLENASEVLGLLRSILFAKNHRWERYQNFLKFLDEFIRFARKEDDTYSSASPLSSSQSSSPIHSQEFDLKITYKDNNNKTFRPERKAKLNILFKQINDNRVKALLKTPDNPKKVNALIKAIKRYGRVNKKNIDLILDEAMQTSSSPLDLDNLEKIHIDNIPHPDSSCNILIGKPWSLSFIKHLAPDLKAALLRYLEKYNIRISKKDYGDFLLNKNIRSYDIAATSLRMAYYIKRHKPDLIICLSHSADMPGYILELLLNKLNISCPQIFNFIIQRGPSLSHIVKALLMKKERENKDLDICFNRIKDLKGFENSPLEGTQLYQALKDKRILIIDDLVQTGEVMEKALSLCLYTNADSIISWVLTDYKQAQDLDFESWPISVEGFNKKYAYPNFLGLFAAKGNAISTTIDYINLNNGPWYKDKLNEKNVFIGKEDGYGLKETPVAEFLIRLFLNSQKVPSLKWFNEEKQKDILSYLLRPALFELEILVKHPIPWKDEERLKDIPLDQDSLRALKNRLKNFIYELLEKDFRNVNSANIATNNWAASKCSLPYWQAYPIR